MVDFDLWTQVPKLNTGVDFTELDVVLDERDVYVLSRVNNMLSLAELSGLLNLPRLELEPILVKLTEHGLIFFDDSRAANALLGVPEEPAPDEPVADAAESGAESTGETPEPSPAPRPAPAGPVESGEWDLDELFIRLTRLHAEKRTGVLRLYADAEHYKVLFFEHGQLLNVLSVPFDAAECLGRVLQRAGYLSQEKVIESLQRAKTSGHKQGEELLAMGAIRKDLLFEMLRVHIEVKMTAVMEWGGGRWTFHDTGDAPSRVTRIDLDLPRLLFNLLWKRYPGDQLQQKVRRFGDRFVGAVVNPPFDVDDFGFGDAFRKFCQIAMEKDNPLKRLLIVSNLKPDQSIRMIWAMHLTGMLGFFDESREDKSLARIEDLKNQLKVIERETLFDVLHVHWTATDHMVEKAYQQRTTELERALARASGLEEELNKTLLQHVKKAYATLKGRDSRREYRQVIYDDDFIVFNSDILRQKGESYLFTKDSIELAVPEFESALEVYDKNGEYWSELGLAYFVRDYPRNMQGAEEARRLIKRGLSMAPSSEIVHLCLGLMYRHEKKNKQAVEALERVLQINASNKFAKILIDEINTGVKSEDYEQVVKDFVDRRSQADKDFDKKMAAKKTDQEGKGRPGARQKAARKTKPSAAS